MATKTKKAIPAEQWKWFGYPGHLCVGSRCMFHLLTVVGEYMISSVGDYKPEKIFDAHRSTLIDNCEGMRETIGAGDEAFFETFVFKRAGTAECRCGCGTPSPDEFSEIDGKRAVNAADATANHVEFCRKYAHC